MKKIIWTLAIAVLALGAYLSLWPIPLTFRPRLARDVLARTRCAVRMEMMIERQSIEGAQRVCHAIVEKAEKFRAGDHLEMLCQRCLPVERRWVTVPSSPPRPALYRGRQAARKAPRL